MVEELADLMVLLIPWLREMGHSLRTEENGRTSSQQLAHVLRTARIVQILSLIHHFLGSVLATAELQPSSSTSTSIPETWSPIQRPTPTTVEDSSSSSSSSTKRKEPEDSSSSSSSSSQHQQKKARE